jgi:PQQ-dependent catabolism-associated CXXCW motif protein
MISRCAWLALALLLGLGSMAGAAEHAAEPEGFWTGPLHGAVPATLAGGTVVDASQLAAIIDKGGAVLVDVSPSPRKPEGTADSAWMPPPHRSIAGSVWLPDVGDGALDPARDAWYRERLAALTQADTARPLVIFCHPECWASWNAARRAVLYGYTSVHWYPDGIEGWQDADRPTAIIEAEAPPP